MSSQIESYLSKGERELAIEECVKESQFTLAKILGYDGEIRVKLLCNWTSSRQLANLWNKMTKGSYKWNRISVVWDGEVDYFVVINGSSEPYDKSRAILFHMEPNMEQNTEGFLRSFTHNNSYNNNEWHLAKTYQELSQEKIVKTKVLSAVVSAKYKDPGHVKRIDFIKFLEKKEMPIDVYGDNKWRYKEYKGSLPPYNKNDGIIPYKYTFAAENHSITNYYTEKLIDGILGECLVFYWGCPNVRNYIDERAFIQLELSNFENDYNIIKTAIEEDWYSKRLPFIQRAKNKILNEQQFFPRLESIIEKDILKKS